MATRAAAGAPHGYELLVEATANRLVALLDLVACHYEPFPFEVQLPRIEPGRIVLPAAEPGVEPWRFGGAIELPVRVGDLLLGRFVLTPSVPTSGVQLPASGRDEAIALAAAAGAAVATALIDEPIDTP